MSDDSYYIGHTEDLEQRINEHNLGIYPGYTTKRLLVNLVYYELFNTRYDALAAWIRLRFAQKQLLLFTTNGRTFL